MVERKERRKPAAILTVESFSQNWCYCFECFVDCNCPVHPIGFNFRKAVTIQPVSLTIVVIHSASVGTRRQSVGDTEPSDKCPHVAKFRTSFSTSDL
jgi:hypothetical protein